MTGIAKPSARGGSRPAFHPPRKAQASGKPIVKHHTNNAHKIESLFASLKDWRRIATRYDRCAHAFFSAICIAAVVIFCINQ